MLWAGTMPIRQQKEAHNDHPQRAAGFEMASTCIAGDSQQNICQGSSRCLVESTESGSVYSLTNPDLRA